MSYRYEGDGKFTDEKTQKQSAPHNNDPWASQSRSDKPTGSDMGSWIFIAFMFAVAWPVGLFFLISKLRESGGGKKTTTKTTYTKTTHTQTANRTTVKSTVSSVTRTPNDSDKSARVMKIVGIVLAVLGAMGCLGVMGDLGYYVEYGGIWQLVSDLSPMLGFAAGGGALLWGSGRMTRRMRRFAKYLAAAGNAQSVSIGRLAAAAEVSERRVERDLDMMIDKGMWGEGAYVDLGAGKLFRSASAGQEHYNRQYAPVTPPQAEQGYSGMLRQIRAANDRIADAELSAKIDRLEEIAGRIFRLIENEPEKKAKASTFLNYYLPTTQKLLDSYAEFEEAGVSGGNLSQAKRKIEQTMDNIVRGFERQLDELYRTDTLDIDSDIRVMETMLRRDTARVEDDFDLGRGRVQTSGGDVSDDFAAPDEGGGMEHKVVCKVTITALAPEEDHKLEVIQAVREATGKPLRDCARLLDTLPSVVMETEGDSAPAFALHRRLKELGAKVTFSESRSTVYRPGKYS